MKRLNRISFIILIISVLIFSIYNYRRAKDIDTEGPEIYVDKKLLKVSINDDESILLQGVTAFDAKDGNVTDS